MCLATLAIASTVVQAVGQVAGGIAQGNQMRYQAQVATNNALIQKNNAVYAASAGAAQTEQAGLNAAERQARIRAGAAANGLDVNTGSPADLQISENEKGNLDTRTVSNNAALQAYGYQVQSTADTAQANLDKSEASYDTASGIIKGIGTLAGSPSIGGSLLGGGGDPTIGGQTGQQFSDNLGSELNSSMPTVPPNFQWMQGG